MAGQRILISSKRQREEDKRALIESLKLAIPDAETVEDGVAVTMLTFTTTARAFEQSTKRGPAARGVGILQAADLVSLVLPTLAGSP